MTRYRQQTNVVLKCHFLPQSVYRCTFPATEGTTERPLVSVDGKGSASSKSCLRRHPSIIKPTSQQYGRSHKEQQQSMVDNIVLTVKCHFAHFQERHNDVTKEQVLVSCTTLAICEQTHETIDISLESLPQGSLDISLVVAFQC